jgi:prophage regulatory protein
MENVQIERILRISEVRARIGLSKSQIYLLINNENFPPPIKLGARASGWLESEVINWVNRKISQSRNSESK